jgi:hypothetical protein
LRVGVGSRNQSLTTSFRYQATLHLDALVPGARTVGVSSKFSMFIYRAAQIMKKDGARLKTVSWRRVPDLCIPARAKVNGAYVNSALAKQEALSCGCVHVAVPPRLPIAVPVAPSPSPRNNRAAPHPPYTPSAAVAHSFCRGAAQTRPEPRNPRTPEPQNLTPVARAGGMGGIATTTTRSPGGFDRPKTDHFRVFSPSKTLRLLIDELEYTVYKRWFQRPMGHLGPRLT